ncbi:MAG: DUF4920 domain-containing protein [Bradymonadia bacterium]
MTYAFFVLVALLQPTSQPTSQPSSQPTSKPSAKSNALDPNWKTMSVGAKLSDGPSVSMDALAKDAAKHGDKTVKVSGKISNVCRKKGCWMVLGGENTTARARVTFKDYAFFVPLDCAGSEAVVEGTVKLKTMSDAERQHLADDAGKSIDDIPKHELRIIATGVSLKRS